MPDLVSEADLQQTIIEAARANGYLVYHSHSSRRSEPGFPDLCIAGGADMGKAMVWFVECKTEKGRLTKGRFTPTRRLPGQEDWAIALDRIALIPNSRVAYRLVRPSDLDELLEELAEHAKPKSKEEPMSNLTETVAQGSKFLDIARPGWRGIISTKRLSMTQYRYCVLGQLYGTYEAGLEALWPGLTPDAQKALAEEHGFQPTDNDYNWHTLEQIWLAEIERRKAEHAKAA